MHRTCCREICCPDPLHVATSRPRWPTSPPRWRKRAMNHSPASPPAAQPPRERFFSCRPLPRNRADPGILRGPMQTERLHTDIAASWRDSILPELQRYVRIPNKSPDFDGDWERHGHMEEAVQLMAAWCRQQSLPGARVEIQRLT